MGVGIDHFRIERNALGAAKGFKLVLGNKTSRQTT
ncbi:MAG: hypothetical protein ACN6Q2_17900 [Pseudomonas laurylsulfatiphila]